MTLLIALLSTAIAATPGGFRTGTARAQDGAGARSVFIFNPGTEIIAQATPRVTKTWKRYGLDVEISALLHTGSGGYIFAGLGSLRSGHWYLFKGPKGTMHHRLGAEFQFPVVPETARVTAWGSAMQETVMPVLFQIGWQASWNEDAPWEVRAMAGGAKHPGFLFGPTPVGEIAVAKVQPVSETVSLVLEQDLLVMDASPASLRPMVRFEFDHAALDTGVQVPWGSWAWWGTTPASIQLITQYRGMF